MDKIERRFTNIEASLKSLGETIDEHFKRGFQKGKLKQKKKELGFLEMAYKLLPFSKGLRLIEERIKQFKREIGGIEK